MVGPEKEIFKVHPVVVRNVSKPLGSLMSNGFLKEAAEQICLLEEEDSSVFAAFVEWAYAGNYRVHLRTSDASAAEKRETAYTSPKKPTKGLNRYYCTGCASQYRFESVNHQDFPLCPVCVAKKLCFRCKSPANREYNGIYLCSTCSQGYGIQTVDLDAKSTHHFELFKKREYPVDGINHLRIRNALGAGVPTDWPSNNLLAHARLYVFADRWLVTPLKELTLHKLHLDLCEYSMDEHGDIEMIKILKYCFSELLTGDEQRPESKEDGQASTFSELRELAITYAACKSEELLKYAQFRTMLKDCGEFALRFIDAINKRFA